MGRVRCARCGKEADGLERAPLPGPPGQAVLERTCGGCWEAWKRSQVMLINEYRLDVLNPAHFERLVSEMQTFLGLRETPSGAGEG